MKAYAKFNLAFLWCDHLACRFRNISLKYGKKNVKIFQLKSKEYVGEEEGKQGN